MEKVAPKMKGITSMSVKASHFFLICVAELCIRIRNWNFLRMFGPYPEPDPTLLSWKHYHLGILFSKSVFIDLIHSRRLADPDPHLFLEAVSGSALEWKAGSRSALKWKFRNCRGSKWSLGRSRSRPGGLTWSPEGYVDQWSQIRFTLNEEKYPDPHWSNRVRLKVMRIRNPAFWQRQRLSVIFYLAY